MLLVVLKGHRYKLRSVQPQGVARSREIPGGRSSTEPVDAPFV